MRQGTGRPVFSGVAIGRAYVYRHQQAELPGSCGDAAAEQKKFDEARETARAQLTELFEKTKREIGEEQAMILDVQMMMLDDLDYLEGVQDMIAGGASAAQAAHETGDAFSAAFAAMDDAYMQARSVDVKDMATRLVNILCGGKKIGVFGKLANEVTANLKLPKDSKANHKIFLGEIDWAALCALMPETMRYQPISEFATVTRDLALVVEEDMPCGTLTNEICKACKQVGNVELFDVYRGEQVGEGKKSMAFKISFVPADKALTPKDLDRFMNKILGNLKHKLNIDVR